MVLLLLFGVWDLVFLCVVYFCFVCGNGIKLSRIERERGMGLS